MKKKKLRRTLYVIFGFLVFIAGHFWVHEKVHSIRGYLVVPEHQPDEEWAISIESDRKKLLDFHLPESELGNIIASQKDLLPENGRSEVKVTYQKNFWNRKVNPKIHVIHPGWIRRP